MKQPQIVNTFNIAIVIAFFMLLTRGSHVLTNVSLPDASIVLFLIGGIFLKRLVWFTLFFMLASIIDFGAAALDPAQGFCLTDGYWGLIPAYASMWLGGLWLSKQADAFSTLHYVLVTTLTSLIAFVISTQTYYLYSGRFPANGINDTIQHGWNYLPEWMGYAGLYFAIFFVGAKAFRILKSSLTASA